MHLCKKSPFRFPARAVVMIAIFISGILKADDVTFFKNSGKFRMYVWVNGSYQGWVDPGTTVYMPREGFVTQDSGFQADGSLKTTHSHGGWEAGGLFEFEGFSAPFEMEGNRVAYYTTGTVSYQKDDKRLGLASGEGVTAVLPSDYDMETAGKMQGGAPPFGVRQLVAKGTSEIPAKGGSNPVGGVTGNAGFPLWYAGYKKAEMASKPVEERFDFKKIAGRYKEDDFDVDGNRNYNYREFVEIDASGAVKHGYGINVALEGFLRLRGQNLWVEFTGGENQIFIKGGILQMGNTVFKK